MDFEDGELNALDQASYDWVSSVFESGRGIDWRASFSAITCPVLLVLGKYDFVAPPTGWSEYPPTSTVEVFHRSSHAPFLEEPEAFMAAVTQSLA
ncbi:MAG TPA: alpha/beta hydrolase [Acidimicrobiales bacterium]|nr:alpha/beta hydrolase [Acidimicrobiales bacterium]